MASDAERRRGWRPWASRAAEDEIRRLRERVEALGAEVDRLKVEIARLDVLEAEINGLKAGVARLEARGPADRDHVERTVRALFERVEMLRRAGEIAATDD